MLAEGWLSSGTHSLLVWIHAEGGGNWLHKPDGAWLEITILNGKLFLPQVNVQLLLNHWYIVYKMAKIFCRFCGRQQPKTQTWLLSILLKLESVRGITVLFFARRKRVFIFLSLKMLTVKYTLTLDIFAYESSPREQIHRHVRTKQKKNNFLPQNSILNLQQVHNY